MNKTFKKYLQEAIIGAPDYNPAKASSGGPGYASMPQQVKLAGDSMWDKDGSNPKMVTITDYEVSEEGDGYVSVTVEHDGPMEIYTDSGFEKAVSDMIGIDVEFSEQGMQEDGRAHLEGSSEMESTNEAVGDAAAPIYDLIDELGSHQLVLDELIRFLDVDQIEEFVADFRRHNDMNEGRMKDSVIHDSETMSKEEFAKKHGKELADEMYESVKESHYPHLSRFQMLYGIEDVEQYKEMADDAQSMGIDEFIDTYSYEIDMAGDFWEDHQGGGVDETAHKLNDEIDYIKKLAGL